VLAIAVDFHGQRRWVLLTDWLLHLAGLVTSMLWDMKLKRRARQDSFFLHVKIVN
jgi:hypothetical protein